MWAIAPQKVDCLTSRLSAAWFAHLMWHRLLWFAEYCGYEGLVDLRRALNVIRGVGHIRNDFTVGPASAASNVTNRHFAQFAPSLACAMEMLQPRHKMILKTFRGLRWRDLEVPNRGNLFKKENQRERLQKKCQDCSSDHWKKQIWITLK